MAFQPYQNFPNNNQYYMQSLQDMRDRLDNQIRNYQQAQAQQPIAQPITQNFQLAPQTNNNDLEGKFADNIDTVKNTFVVKTGVFLTKDYSTMWIKGVDGNIRTFKTEEVIELDAKDREILDLQKQVNELKGMIENESKYNNSVVDESVTNENAKRTSTSKRTNAK